MIVHNRNDFNLFLRLKWCDAALIVDIEARIPLI